MISLRAEVCIISLNYLYKSAHKTKQKQQGKYNTHVFQNSITAYS